MMWTCKNCGHKHRAARCPRCGQYARPMARKGAPEAEREYWERVSRTRVRREGEEG